MAATADLTAIEAELQRRLDPAPRRQNLGIRTEILKTVPRIIFADGFSLSVQAGDCIYCTPRDSVGPWTHVEIGFPSAKVDAFLNYIDGDENTDPTSTVYGYVPLSIVASVVAEHGGFADHPAR